jgi:hypothetical protein
VTAMIETLVEMLEVASCGFESNILQVVASLYQYAPYKL